MDILGNLKMDLKMLKFQSGMEHFATPKQIETYEHDVMFSGGFDSTLMLLLLCEIKKNEKLDDMKINVIMIDGFGNTQMMENELNARTKILDEIKKDYDFEICEKKLDCKFYGGGPNTKATGGGYNLQHAYVSLAMMHTAKTSILYVGSNGSDEDLIFFHHLQDMIKSIDAFYTGENDTILAAPLFNFTKSDVLYTILKFFNKYAKMITTCQYPNGAEPCGVCEKCIEYSDAMNLLSYNLIREKNGKNINVLEDLVSDLINLSEKGEKKFDSISIDEICGSDTTIEITKSEEEFEKELSNKSCTHIIQPDDDHIYGTTGEVKELLYHCRKCHDYNCTECAHRTGK
jgi:hypothetical protein